MREQNLDISGAVTFWQADDSDREKLRLGLDRIGSDLMPPDRRPEAILHQALNEEFKNNGRPKKGEPRTLVRRLRDKGAFTVVTEYVGDFENEYRTSMSVTVNETGQIAVNPWLPEIKEAIEKRYDAMAAVVPAASITNLLVTAVGALQGLPLRDRGAVYWLPNSRLERWGEIAKVVEEAGSKNSIYLMRTAADEQALRAIHDGIIADIARDVAEIEKDVADGAMGVRGLEERQRRAEALASRLKIYEGILGETLTPVQETIDMATMQVAEAIILKSAELAKI